MKKWTNKAANVYKEHSNLTKGDRLFIFMPRSPELYFSLLGAVKMGVIVGPLFEAFMEGAVYDRLVDSEAKAIVTTPELLERVPLDKLPNLETVFLVGDNIEESEKFIDFKKALHNASDAFDIEWVDKEDGLILHYTSGSTGKPKGILHVHDAMVQQYQSMKWVMEFVTKIYIGVQLTRLGNWYFLRDIWSMVNRGYVTCSWWTFFTRCLV